jgi:hypothetical protein
MQNAITKCYAVDDCKQIAKQANAIAAYFKQIKDDESVRRFLAVKLRAWRRIGEILLTMVDLTDCGTNIAACARKIKGHFPNDPGIMDMTDTDFSNALKLGRMPADFFENEMKNCSSMTAMFDAYKRVLDEKWKASPAGKEFQEEQKIRQKEYAATQAKWAAAAEEKRAKEVEEAQKAAEKLAEEAKQQQDDLKTLREARDEALEAITGDEVGYTMDRRDRLKMKTVVFMIKEPVHKTLRQAAFDNHMTMQAVLRAGLAMWFIANGYPVDTDSIRPSRKPSSPQPGARTDA